MSSTSSGRASRGSEAVDDPGGGEVVTRYGADDGVPTLAAALLDLLNTDELKRLATLTPKRAPTRKDDLLEHLLEHLAGDRLRAVWQGLDELEKAAVAEVVHSGERRFPASRFRAKYGRLPDFGSLDRSSRGGHVSPLRFFFVGDGNVMPDDLRERLAAFVPPPAKATVTSVDALPAVHEEPFSQGTDAPPFFVRETERTASRELLSVLRLVDSGKVSVSATTRRPSAAAVDAITTVLDGGDYYPFQPPRDGRDDENAGPHPGLRMAPARPGGRARAALGLEAAADEGGTQGADRSSRPDPEDGLVEVAREHLPRRAVANRLRQGTDR